MAKFVSVTTAGKFPRVVWLNVDRIVSMARCGATPQTNYSNELPEHTQISMTDDKDGHPARVVLETPEYIAMMAAHVDGQAGAELSPGRSSSWGDQHDR